MGGGGERETHTRNCALPRVGGHTRLSQDATRFTQHSVGGGEIQGDAPTHSARTLAFHVLWTARNTTGGT